MENYNVGTPVTLTEDPSFIFSIYIVAHNYLFVHSQISDTLFWIPQQLIHM